MHARSLTLGQALHKRSAADISLLQRTIFDSDVERLHETPAFLASRSTTWRVLAGTRLTLADAWDDEGQPRAGR
jgi:hypothetical protein